MYSTIIRHLYNLESDPPDKSSTRLTPYIINYIPYAVLYIPVTTIL